MCHTLNSTAIATERAICCILENYQQEDGTIRIPEVLIPYMNGKTIIGRQI
jgi:seryl-tRNA synthetase